VLNPVASRELGVAGEREPGVPPQAQADGFALAGERGQPHVVAVEELADHHPLRA
jgi:hypothetical protein